MKGDARCDGGRLMQHCPQPDDPDLETDIGPCMEFETCGCQWGKPASAETDAPDDGANPTEPNDGKDQ